MTRKLVTALSRGGGAKTISSVHIAHGLALNGKKVLLVDTDPQGDCLQYLYELESKDVTKNGGLYEVMKEIKSFEEVVLTPRTNLDLLAGTQMLKPLINDLIVRDMGKEYVLTDALEKIEERYDYIIIDTTPTQTIMNINAYFYAEEMIIPYWLQPSTFKNMKEFIEQYERIAVMQRKLFKEIRLHLKYILPVMEVRTAAVKSSYLELKSLIQSYKTLADVDLNYEMYRDISLLESIPRRTKFEQLPNFGNTIFEIDPLSEGAQAYNLVIEEILKDEKAVKRQNG